VTASGKLVRADAQQNSDLFWAARGAGPGFPGIVTRFHLQTRSAPILMRSSGYVYAMSDYRTAFNWILKVTTRINATKQAQYEPILILPDPFWI